MPLILPSQRLIRPNPLAYPAGAVPGFDPSHPASNHALLSAISTGANFVNLIPSLGGSTVKGTVNSTITPGIHGKIGPYTKGFSTGNVTLPGLALTGQRYITFAAIITISPGQNVGVFGVNSPDGPSLATFGTSQLYFSNTTADINSTITLDQDTAYFIAASHDNSAGICNFIAAPLNGKTPKTSVISAGVNGLMGGSSWIIGKEAKYNTNFTDAIAAVMHSSGSQLSIPQLQQWARSPWEFWYPNKTINLVGSTVAATFLAAWARGSNLPVIGTGNY